MPHRRYIIAQAIYLTALGLRNWKRYYIASTLLMERVNIEDFRLSSYGVELSAYASSKHAATAMMLMTTSSDLRRRGVGWRRCEDPGPD